MSRALAMRHPQERLEVSISKTVSIKSSPGACRLAALAVANDGGMAAKTRARNIAIKMPGIKDTLDNDRLADVFRDLYMRGEFLDVALVCGGQSFQAHKAMLAAHSDVFRKGLATCPPAAHGARQEVSFADIGNPDAVKVMLDYVYQADIATWEERNLRLLPELATDVIRLGSHFNLPGLVGLAARWLTAGITTHNVLERLARCEELGLEDMRVKILQHVAKDRDALADVSTNRHLVQNPQLLQELLQHAADPQPKRKVKAIAAVVAPKKKARKS